jgi:hypothetical protein
MDPAFAAEITPGIWAWISDDAKSDQDEAKLTVNIPPDLKHWVEKG